MSHDVSSGKLKHIRNFSIIAHIDHGKSTLSDRLIQTCGGLTERELKEQVLDSMDIERERGHHHQSSVRHAGLHRCRWPGVPAQLHRYPLGTSTSPTKCRVRSMPAKGPCWSSTRRRGVEAQSVANCYTAIEQGLEVLPVLNKIDLPQADPDRVAQEVEEIIGLDATDACQVSAKSGIGINELLERLVRDIPPPKGDPEAPLQALIIDSWFDNYLGVVSLVRLFDGTLRKGDKIRIKSTGRDWNATEVGIFTPLRKETNILRAGEVGFIVAGIKEIHGAPVGGYHYPYQDTRRTTFTGLSKSEAAGLRRYVPGQRRRLRRFPRCLGKAGPQ